MHQSRRTCRQDSAEVRGVQVGHRQAEIGVIREIENLSPELDPQATIDGKGTDERHVDVGVRRSARDIAAGIAELAGLRLRIETFERRPTDPCIDGVRTSIRIADDIGTARRKTRDRRAVRLQRDVGGIGNSGKGQLCTITL